MDAVPEEFFRPAARDEPAVRRPASEPTAVVRTLRSPGARLHAVLATPQEDTMQTIGGKAGNDAHRDDGNAMPGDDLDSVTPAALSSAVPSSRAFTATR